ncbi:hypothetical protein [Secundilactobacillus pentosiphilus]|uniref:hypothetical protein n=1 Tax=Secundilactobacillus pentosiphilus TaxID=1714682 RepID=UPI000F771603|nr:hypothetical protein [Secundilactobacillus pentosiphilus]
MLKANKQINLHPNYYTKNSLYYARIDLDDYVATFNDLAYHGAKGDDQAWVDGVVQDAKDLINYKAWNAKYAE